MGKVSKGHIVASIFPLLFLPTFSPTSRDPAFSDADRSFYWTLSDYGHCVAYYTVENSTAISNELVMQRLRECSNSSLKSVSQKRAV
ncbi:hypothetical protein BDZ88DRAFT_57732 [Geranomyces variabilis]|nr:hypothetical protein BDZ88DRAFT_57732 [Geranomyces variabilis]KAJ3133900.1 hypothetical protein HDU90_005508 [Geranomyces variabilis]